MQSSRLLHMQLQMKWYEHEYDTNKYQHGKIQVQYVNLGFYVNSAFYTY